MFVSDDSISYSCKLLLLSPLALMNVASPLLANKGVISNSANQQLITNLVESLHGTEQ
jgi:hypothetical protein